MRLEGIGLIKQLLLGTRNQEKVNIIKIVAKNLPLKILSLSDLKIEVEVIEDRNSPKENAIKKAKTYFSYAKISTLAIDAGLFFDKLPIHKQPGAFVRRHKQSHEIVSDKELLDFYRKELEELGGSTKGFFEVYLALATKEGIITNRYTIDLLFTSNISDKILPGAPLSSLSQEPETKKYLSEMNAEERPDSKWIVDFIEKHLDKI